MREISKKYLRLQSQHVEPVKEEIIIFTTCL